ncbi:response regulator [Leucobacter celer]|uniref:response regulator n=1 Tax=Leucobacter celer TaxID=668625 RepID=UPI0006A7E3E5|nr:response regulator transcription factor [Leucobacter celer]
MHPPTAERPVRVAIIDDEALIRQGFTLILEAAADIRVVGAADGRDALALIDRTSPDVVLLDIRMPEVDGLTVLRSLPRGAQAPRVAMLTTFGSDDLIAEAMSIGAAGFLLKDTDPEALPQYVRTLASGGVVLAPAAARAVVGASLAPRYDPEAAALIDTLSDRERDVLLRLARGRSNAEIGAEIHLGTGTVKDHVSALLAKLGVPGRVQAALVAERGGLLEGTG